MVSKLEEIALRKHVTVSQLALAWVMAQGNHIFPIPGTKRIKYLEENAEAIKIHFSNEELDEINRIAPKGAVAGLRYPVAMMGSINQ